MKISTGNEAKGCLRVVIIFGEIYIIVTIFGFVTGFGAASGYEGVGVVIALAFAVLIHLGIWKGYKALARKNPVSQETKE